MFVNQKVETKCYRTKMTPQRRRKKGWKALRYEGINHLVSMVYSNEYGNLRDGMISNSTAGLLAAISD
jgi:hypothetical protein